MNPLWGPLAGAFIVVMMLGFIGIWIWAWRPRHASDFQAMARVPLEEEPTPAAAARGDAR